LKAVAHASDETALEGLRDLDHTYKLFVDGVRKAFEEGRPFQTRKAAFYVMPVIQDKWFDDSLGDIMSGGEKDEFCKNWGSAVDGIEHTAEVKKASYTTLFAILNSKRWRSHVVKDKLKLMECFTELPEDSKYFTACKKNASVLPWLGSRADEGGEEGTKEPKLWLAILWLDYANLPKNVMDQVSEATKVVISKARHDVNFISRIMAAEKERSQAELDKHEATSLEDKAERLRAKLKSLNESIERFADVVGKKRK